MRKSICHWLFIALALFVVVSCGETTQKNENASQSSPQQGTSEIQKLSDVIAADSLNPESYYLRSKLYLGGFEVNKALADINKAIQLDNKNSDYFVVLSDIYLAMNRIPNCLDALKKAEELDGTNNNALLKLSEIYLILKDYDKSFAYANKALDLEQLNPKAHFTRGYAYMELGDTTLAIRSFEAASNQDPNYFEAFIELGILYAAQGNALAAQYFQTAARIKPDRSEAYYLLGMFYQNQENIPKAVETYEKLLTIDPEYKEAHYNLGYINLVYTNDFEKAVSYFTTAITLDPKYTDAIFNRGYSYELMGDFSKARIDYQKALEVTPNYERAIEGLNRLDK